MKKFLSMWIPTTVIASAVAVSLSGCTGGLPAPTVYRNPYDAVQTFMEGMYLAENDIGVSQTHRVRAAIVPQHLVSTEAVAAGIRSLVPGHYKRIVLLAPDHFGKCPTLLCTTNGTYQTFFGDVHTSTGGVLELLRSPATTLEPDMFRGEHGIFAVVPYIAHYLPGADLIPVALSQDFTWAQRREKILEALRPLLDDDTALVVSSDFSHYLPLGQSNDKDKATMMTFLAGDMDRIAQLENPSQSDCPGCLWTLAALAKEQGFFNPSVLLHTNSATLLGDQTVAETTSHFAIAFYQNDILTAADPAFAGDVTLTRGSAAPLSRAVRAFWTGSGARIVNLEGPLAESCPPMTHPFIFCNPLERWREIAGLATDWAERNNHMMDRGLAGIRETERLLEENSEHGINEIPVTHDGLRLLSLTTFLNPVENAQAFDIDASVASVMAALKTPSDALTVVIVHDGTEYDALASDASAALYRSLIDKGADAVIVAHAHVPGDMEIYKEKLIFRGLGNFLFDQTDSIATSTAKIVRLRKGSGAILFQTLTGR